MIRGAGGGKDSGSGGGRAPIESPDSLRSIQYARVVDLWCEGEVYGLADGAKSVFLDDTPLQNADGSYNFSGVSVQQRTGTQTQTYIAGFSSVESENSVNENILYTAAVTRRIENSNVNRVRVTVGVPRLSYQNPTTGDLSGQTVGFTIEVQTDDGGFMFVLSDVITGKTMTLYERSYEFALPGEGPWDIRISRDTIDSVSALTETKTIWTSYTEIIDAKFSYPNSALVAISLDASQFNAIPRRAYDVLGMIVRVPSNYAPATRGYSGAWDGTFKLSWTDNPAWCFYDLLTNSRYGLGDFLNLTLADKWSLYAIGQYCDELVDDGFGGQEPRFTCNLYLQTQEEAFKVIVNMASIFAGMVYWGTSDVTDLPSLITSADMPSDPVAIYNAANVIGGKFAYEGTAKNTRHTVALVAWNDPEDAYRQKIEYVEDHDGIDRYGVVETQVVAFGCISRGQAHRLGRRILYSERMQTETVTFSVGLDALFAAPGDIIEIADPNRAGVRWGGRVVYASGVNITLDSSVSILPGFIGLVSFELSCMLPDGSLETRPIASHGESASLTLGSAFSIDPQRDAVWVMRSALILNPQKFRVLSVLESSKTQYQITALKHVAEKYAAVESDIVLEPAPTSLLRLRPDGVTNLTVVESLVELAPGLVANRATVSWLGTTGRYAPAYREKLGNWVQLPEMGAQTFDINSLKPAIYVFSVTQINQLGIRGPANELTVSIYGKLAPPADVANFTVIKSTGFALAQWALQPDLDVRIGGSIVIRHAQATSGAVWEDGLIMQIFPGGISQGLCPLVTGTYMAKAIDSSGTYSDNAVSFVLTEGMITGFTTVATVTESPTFPGTKTNCAVSASKLSLASGILWDSIGGNVDDIAGDIDNIGGQALTGSYDFDSVLDLSTVATRRFEADITVQSIDNSDTWDSHLTLIDDWDGLIDGAVINDCDATLYARTTDDDPAGTPTWGDWVPFLVSDFTCRAVEMRLDLTADTINHNIQVSLLRVHAKVPA